LTSVDDAVCVDGEDEDEDGICCVFGKICRPCAALFVRTTKINKLKTVITVMMMVVP
jgi:hypothetical protein